MKTLLIRCPAFGHQTAPINLAILSTYLQTNGVEVTSFDFNIELYNCATTEDKAKFWSMNSYSLWDDPSSIRDVVTDFVLDGWVKRILDHDPAVVGLSIYMTSLRVSLILAEKIRAANSSIKIILGGPFCRIDNGIANLVLNKEYVDAVVLGEGEVSLLELIKQLDLDGDFSNTDGCLIKKNGKVQEFAPRKPIKDLSSQFFPDFSDFNLSLYSERVIPLLCSRSCIYNCAFCDERSYWGKFRSRSGKNVFDEMIYQIDKYDINEFYFCDLAINGNLKVLEDLCDLIIESKRKIYWAGYLLCRKMKRELVLKMGKAGCKYLCLGIETGSKEMLTKMNKNFTIEIAEELLGNLFDANVNTHTAWIVGFPGEMDRHFQETLDFIDRNRRNIKQVNPASLLKIPAGSPIWKNPETYGVKKIVHTDLWHDKVLTENIKKARADYFNTRYATKD